MCAPVVRMVPRSQAMWAYGLPPPSMSRVVLPLWFCFFVKFLAHRVVRVIKYVDMYRALGGVWDPDRGCTCSLASPALPRLPRGPQGLGLIPWCCSVRRGLMTGRYDDRA